MVQPSTRLSDLVFHPCTVTRWSDLEELFGERGACGGCWCMFWRLPRKEFDGVKERAQTSVQEDRVVGFESLAYSRMPQGTRRLVRLSAAPDYVALERSRILNVDEQAVGQSPAV